MSKLTPFQQKFHELDDLKKDTLKIISKFNALHLDYEDWFKRRRQTFIDIMKRLQVGFRSLSPQKVNTIAHFKSIRLVAREIQSSNQRVPQFQDLDKFLVFWERYCSIKEEMDRLIMARFEHYCGSISRLREPEIKENLDFLYYELNEQFSESFDFRGTHNEKDNLYTYKIATCDSEFHGLVAYIPFLIGLSNKICYLITKNHLEKL